RRTRDLEETPPFRAMLACRLRTVEHFALAAIESRELIGGGHVHPDHPIAVHVEAARPARVAMDRHLIHLGRAALPRRRPALDADDSIGALRRGPPGLGAGEWIVGFAARAAPHAAVRPDAGLIAAELNTVVLRWIDR